MASGLNLFRRVVSFQIVFMLGFGPTISFIAQPARADGQKISQEKVQETFTQVLPYVQKKEHVLSLLERAGSSIESLKVIERDLSKRMPADYVLPKLSLIKNEIHADGKPTGIKIISFAPMKLKYQGQTWMLNANKSTDENYLNLVRFFEKKRKMYAFDLIAPPAEALFETGMSGLGWGALFGGLAGVGIAWMTGAQSLSDYLMPGLMGVGMGSMLGYTYGNYNQTVKQQQQNTYSMPQYYSPPVGR